MAQKQNEKEALICTKGNCKKLQTEDGEFCENHFPPKLFSLNSEEISIIVSDVEYFIDDLSENDFMSEKSRNVAIRKRNKILKKLSK